MLPSTAARRRPHVGGGVTALAVALGVIVTAAGCAGEGTDAAPPAGAATSSAVVASSASAPSVSPSSGSPSSGATPAPSPQRCPAPSRRVVRHAPGAGRTVALTFDDGPGGATPQVRAVLRRYGVRATFFDVGARSVEYAAEERALAADGHLVVDHSWDHLYPAAAPWTNAHVRDQLRRTDAAISANTGAAVCLFRPPGGIMTNVPAAAAAEGLSVVLWSQDTQDWAQPATTTAAATSAIVRRATTTPGDHPIVLLHADKASHEPESEVHAHRGNTVAALGRIIEWYRDRGYRFVDVAGGAGLN